MIKLYDYPQCPFCRKVRITLFEKGIHYERIVIDLKKKEQKKEEFLRLNPYGKVPVLVDNGAVIYESSIINEYLDEKYPNPPLMPSTPEQRARARILIDFCESHFHVPWFNIYAELNFKSEGERNLELIEKSKKELEVHLQRLNTELEGRPYLLGDFTLADISFIPRIALFDTLGIKVPSELKNVVGWIERLQSRPSYSSLEL
ncbi:MAG: stringent starvation protein A [Deltaproteobacteria bacterium]|jgi:glutathione S-transferase|nr:MAG: stringent starvation protein A [Deltaproteobacteria bacterium]